MKRNFLVFLFVCGLSFSLFAEPRLLTILFTNDSHGMAWAFDAPDSPKTGGLAAQKTLIEQIRNEVQLTNGDVVVLSSGNVTMGDPRSNICENLPMISGMNLIGYDGMLIGSHEFDFGMKTFFPTFDGIAFENAFRTCILAVESHTCMGGAPPDRMILHPIPTGKPQP